MKTLFTFILLFSAIILPGQQTDSLGIGNNELFNKHELEYLNSLFKGLDTSFDDFRNKRILFISGEPEIKIISKKEFFDTYIKPALKKNALASFTTIGLEQDAIKKSGGYEVIFKSPTGGLSNKQKSKIFKQLRKQQKINGSDQKFCRN